MTEALLIIAAVILMIVVAVGSIVFSLAKAGGPLALETPRQLDIVRRRMKDPVSANLQVTGITEPSFDCLECTAQLTGVVSGEGLEPRAMQRKGMLRVARWPTVGQRLPVIVDRANPKFVFLDQTNVEIRPEAALEEAERLAAEMKAETD